MVEAAEGGTHRAERGRGASAALGARRLRPASRPASPRVSSASWRPASCGRGGAWAFGWACRPRRRRGCVAGAARCSCGGRHGGACARARALARPRSRRGGLLGGPGLLVRVRRRARARRARSGSASLRRRGGGPATWARACCRGLVTVGRRASPAVAVAVGRRRPRRRSSRSRAPRRAPARRGRPASAPRRRRRGPRARPPAVAFLRRRRERRPLPLGKLRSSSRASALGLRAMRVRAPRSDLLGLGRVRQRGGEQRGRQPAVLLARGVHEPAGVARVGAAATSSRAARAGAWSPASAARRTPRAPRACTRPGARSRRWPGRGGRCASRPAPGA